MPREKHEPPIPLRKKQKSQSFSAQTTRSPMPKMADNVEVNSTGSVSPNIFQEDRRGADFRSVSTQHSPWSSDFRKRSHTIGEEKPRGSRQNNLEAQDKTREHVRRRDSSGDGHRQEVFADQEEELYVDHNHGVGHDIEPRKVDSTTKFPSETEDGWKNLCTLLQCICKFDCFHVMMVVCVVASVLVWTVFYTGVRYTPTLDVCVYCAIYAFWATTCLPWLVLHLDRKLLVLILGTVFRLFAADIGVMSWCYFRGHRNILQRGLRLKPVFEPSMAWLAEAGYNLRYGVMVSAVLMSIISLVGAGVRAYSRIFKGYGNSFSLSPVMSSGPVHRSSQTISRPPGSFTKPPTNNHRSAMTN